MDLGRGQERKLTFLKKTNFYFLPCWIFVAESVFSLVVARRGYSLVEHWLSGAWASVIVACRLSFPAACRIFLDQG